MSETSRHGSKKSGETISEEGGQLVDVKKKRWENSKATKYLPREVPENIEIKEKKS